MPKESHLEFKVGLFVLTALIGLAVFIFSVTESSLLEKRKVLKVVFDFANGLKKNAPVRVAGVDYGSVQDISLFFDRKGNQTKVMVNLWLTKKIQIPKDSVVMINQLGLMGEKYVEIIPGVSTKDFFQEGQVLIGKNPVAQEILSEKVWTVAGQVEDAVKGINRVLLDKKNVDSLQKTLGNLSTLTGSINGIIYDIKEGKGTVGKLLYDEHLYDNLQELSADLKANPWKILYRPREKR